MSAASRPSARWRRWCCPLHLVAGFATSREPCLNTAGAADAGEAEAARTSFSDTTPKERSGFCRRDATLAAGQYESLRPGRALVLRRARVLAPEGVTFLDEHDVVVRDGLIESVHPSRVPPPAAADLLDARGKCVIPGLSDIHAHPFVTHWAQAFAPLIRGGGDGSAWVLPYELQLMHLLSCGITRVEVLAGCPDTLWMRDGIREGTIVGPRLSVGSPLIDGQPLRHSALMSYSVGDFQGGLQAAERLCDLGFDFAKPYSNLPLRAYEGLMQGLARRGKRAMGHVPALSGWRPPCVWASRALPMRANSSGTTRGLNGATRYAETACCARWRSRGPGCRRRSSCLVAWSGWPARDRCTRLMPAT